MILLTVTRAQRDQKIHNNNHNIHHHTSQMVSAIKTLKTPKKTTTKKNDSLHGYKAQFLSHLIIINQKALVSRLNGSRYMGAVHMRALGVATEFCHFYEQRQGVHRSKGVAPVEMFWFQLNR